MVSSGGREGVREGVREGEREIRGGPLSMVYFGGDNYSIIVQPNFLRRPPDPIGPHPHARI